MRIALYHDLPSGGAKRAVHELSKRLTFEHQLDVFALSTADHAFADLRPVVRSHRVYDFQRGKLFESPFGRLNQAVRVIDLLRLRSLARRVAEDIDRQGYDVVFAHPGQCEKAPFVLRYCASPTAYYCHEPHRQLYEAMPARPYERRTSITHRLLDRLDPLLAVHRMVARRADLDNARRASRVLVNSRFVGRAVREIYGIEPELCYLGVDGDRFRPQGLARLPFLLSVGSLTPMKGFDFLVEAVAHLPPAWRVPLVIASNFQNPPERLFLESLAERLGVELRLIGNVTDATLCRLYNEAAMTVYAPVREPFGLVPLESMACGTAVVAVREGGVPETVIHGKTGLLVERDPRAFADSMLVLLQNPARAEEYGRCGRNYVLEHWTWEQSAERVVRCLRAVRAGGRPESRQAAPCGNHAGPPVDGRPVGRKAPRD